jgi:hypothetical protein
LRHVDVENQEIWFVQFDGVYRGQAVVGYFDFQSELLAASSQGLDKLLVIVGNQDQGAIGVHGRFIYRGWSLA